MTILSFVELLSKCQNLKSHFFPVMKVRSSIRNIQICHLLGGVTDDGNKLFRLQHWSFFTESPTNYDLGEQSAPT
jgi:hypothetical protein